MSDECFNILKSEATLQVPGFSVMELATAICNASEYESRARGNLQKSMEYMRVSRWPDITRSVAGGLQHVISVDNAANYAELWYQGGSWYAVTGADPNNPTLTKSTVESGIYQLPRVAKNTPAKEAVSVFLSTFFGPSALAKSKGCGCSDKS